MKDKEKLAVEILNNKTESSQWASKYLITGGIFN